jgi:hypothetical protein
MISVVNNFDEIIFRKNDLFKNIFWCLARTKKLRNAKIRVCQMSTDSGNVRSPIPDSDEQVWSDPVISGWILAVLARSGRLLTMVGIRQYSGRNLVRWHPATMARFWRQQDIGDRMLLDSGRNLLDPAESGHIRLDPGCFGQIRPTSDHGRNPAIFRPESGPPASGDGGRIPEPIRYRRPNIIGLRRRLDSDDQQLLNSDNQISNVRVRTKSLIS